LRVLILGGSTEASELARRVAGDPRYDVTLSLAGRTIAPKPQPVPMRSGGFGGVDGLIAWLKQESVDAVVDATHPYADRISFNAVSACNQLALPLASIVREAWKPQAGDVWQEVAGTEAAADALGPTPRRVFLSLGRQDLGVFARRPHHHYVARMIDPPEGVALPPDIKLLFNRGPFDKMAEEKLLREERIDVVVSKNAGAAAVYAKIEATRSLGIPVVMVARPVKMRGDAVESVEEAIAWLERRLVHHTASCSERGV
jgi:precorrin-6A/cobalt-precorrin-6A reductase